MSHPRLPRITALAATVALASGLVACGTGGDEAASPAPETTTEATSTTATTPAESETPTSSSSADSTTTSEDRATSNAADSSGLPEDVAEAAEIFGPLAPPELFEQFDSCNPTGLEGSYECSGDDVGQFQFFDSQSKAASTTQLLTELRSSRVMEDTGRRVVGWSTLGTTAVITVVDNELGLVMQQLVSSDLVEPEERIRELGLLRHPETTTTTSQSRDDSSAEFSTADERGEPQET